MSWMRRFSSPGPYRAALLPLVAATTGGLLLLLALTGCGGDGDGGAESAPDARFGDGGPTADSVAGPDHGVGGDVTIPEDDGCSCEVGAKPTPGAPLLGLLLLGLLWRRRR